MNIEQVTREVTVRGKVQGMDQVADAYNKTADGADRAAVSTDKTTKAQISAGAAVEKVRLGYQDNYRQQQQYAAAQAASQRTVAMDMASVRDALVSVAAGIYVVKSAYDAIAAGSDAASSAMGRANSGMMNGAKEAANYLPGIIAAVWQQGIDKLNQYVELSQKAGTLGTDFYQTLTAAAANAKKPADEYLKVVENIGKALERQLGSNGNQNGSAFNGLVTGLQNGGNLQGQLSNVSRVNNAITGPEQLNAAFTLIKGVLNAGETLVALKLAGTLLGPEAAANLKNDNDYIFKIEQSIKSVQDKDIIKQADIDRAAGLKVELDNAKKIIDSWFTSKATGDWSALGTEIQQLWVNANSNFAAILKVVDSIFARSKEIAAIKPDPESSLWTKVGDFFNDGTIQKLTDATRAYAIAQDNLASRLQNPQNVANAGIETQRAGDLFGDRSIPAGASAATKEATASILENAAATKLQAENVSRSAGAAAAATAAAQLEAAALKDGLSPEVERLTSRYSLLVQAATDAADALDKATKAKAAQDAYKAGADSVQTYIEATKLEIEYHGQAAGKLKEAQVNAQLYALALKEGLAPEQARATVAATGLGRAAGELATKLEVLNKKPDANDQVDRAINTLQRHVEQQKADTAAVGLGAAALARFRVEAAETAAILANKGKIDSEQVTSFEKLKIAAYDAAKALAEAKIASQIDFSNKTKFLSQEDVAIAQQLSEKYGNDVPRALASTEAAQLRVINLQKDMKSSFDEVGKAAFSAALQGKLGLDGLVSSLDAVAKKLSDKAFDNLLSGNPDQMVVGALQAGASAVISLFTGDVKAKQELQKAQQAWAAMGMQITNFNVAAKGFTLGPLTNELQSLYSTSKQLQDAAFKAKDAGGASSAANSFNSAVERIWTEFKTGNQVLTPLQQQIKSVNDEAAGLKDTLSQIGFSGRAAQIDGIVQAQIDALTKQFNATFISGLTARLNTANGKAFLNDAANLLVQHQQDLASVSDLGNDPTLLGQVATTFKAEAQKIVDGAGLVGTAFTDFTTQFPMLQGVVHEFTQSAVDDSKALADAAKAQRDAINSNAKSVLDYINGLISGPNSTYSPTTTLANAQSVYNANLVLAQSGDAGAQSNFPQLADNLDKAARAVFASTQGYQDIKSQIISQGLGLPAVLAADDPTVVVMRDVLTAINNGNLAQATDATLIGTIKAAIDAGNAANVATALSTYFNAIDTNTSQSIDFTEMQNALGGMVSNAALRDMFTRLDTDNSGSVDRLELIKAASQATQGSTASTVSQLQQVTALQAITNQLGDTSNALAGTANSVANTMASLLTAIQGLQTNGNAQLALMSAAFDVTNGRLGSTQNVYGNSSNVAQATSTTGVVVQNQMVQALNKIAWNTFVIANNTSLTVPQSGGSGPGHLFGTYATGGVIPAYGLGLVSEHSAGGGRFIRAGAEPITVSPYPAGNDNSEIRALRAQIEALTAVVERMDENNVRATEGAALHVREGVDAVARDTGDMKRAAKMGR